MNNIDLGYYMKEYEKLAETNLLKKTPVIIKVLGKFFRAFTREFEKPFDTVVIEAMQATLQYLCERLAGCILELISSKSSAGYLLC